MKTHHKVVLLLAAASLPSALSFVAPFSSSSCQQAPLLWMTTTDSDQDLKTGKVAWFNAFRGFGFISIGGGEGDVYVHQSNIKMDGFRKLEESAEVQFRIGIDDSERGGGKAYAYDVTLLGSDGSDSSDGGVAGRAEGNGDQIVDEEVTVDVEEISEIEEVEDSAEIETVGEVGSNVDPRVSAVEESATEAAQTPAPATLDVADESIDEGEKAFNILVSLGMVEQTPDPDDAEYDNSKDDELAPHTNI